jgi:hypothetical protein
VASKDGGSRKKRAPKAAKADGAGNDARNDTGHASGDDRAAARRVALMKSKLSTAMEDPLMRSQIVAAIRTMMKEGR